MKHRRQYKILTTWVLILSMLLSFAVHAKSPKAGTLIRNQASASYKDAAGVKQFATSNLVETLIQQVASMELTQDQSQIGAAGNTVYMPHVLTNTGNGVDRYDLSVVNDAGDDYDFDTITLYADANKDGIPDSSTPITSTGALAADESFYFVIGAVVPASATTGQHGKLTVTGTSTFVETPADIVVAQTNTDTVTVSDKAIITVTKSMSANSGKSPSGPYIITLKYKNNGVTTATDVKLIDVLPTGMNYSAGGALWSEMGATGLTDTDNDLQTTGNITATIDYCAYKTGCSNEVSAVISEVAAGASGEVTFQVNIDTGLTASTLINVAQYAYNNGVAVIPYVDTNKVPFKVSQTLGVIANGSSSNATDGADNLGGTSDSFIVASATRGASVPFDNIIRNTGNDDDTFEIIIDEANSSFPAGTVFRLFKSDGFTPLMDTNSNGTLDTGIVAAGASYNVVLHAVLPANATGNNSGNGFEVSKKAVSAQDNTIFNDVKDHLNEITSDSVDLTNAAALGDAAALGVGAGSLTSAITTKNISPAGKAIFILFVNNTSDTANTYQLQYSKDKPFVANSVEAGWNIAFHVDGGNADCSTLGQITSTTRNIAAGESQQICAVITAPANAVADGVEHPLYFRVHSPLSGASDIKYDAVIVTEQAALSIAPNQIGQVEPGSTIIYSHRISNNGNTALECVNVNVVDGNPQSAWSSIIYKDVNEDGQLDAGDTPLVNQTLAAGESFPILIKLFAPATVAMGVKNIQTLSVVGHQDDGDANPASCTGSALNDAVQDLTTVNSSKVSIIKEQAIDADCSGGADGSFSTTTFQVQPGACVVYRLTATNTGTTTVNNARIDDAAPTFTTFLGGATVSLSTVGASAGNITGGAAGTEGTISAGSVGGANISLSSGESMILTFEVKLD